MENYQFRMHKNITKPFINNAIGEIKLSCSHLCLYLLCNICVYFIKYVHHRKYRNASNGREPNDLNVPNCQGRYLNLIVLEFFVFNRKPDAKTLRSVLMLQVRTALSFELQGFLGGFICSNLLKPVTRVEPNSPTLG